MVTRHKPSNAVSSGWILAAITPLAIAALAGWWYWSTHRPQPSPANRGLVPVQVEGPTLAATGSTTTAEPGTAHAPAAEPLSAPAGPAAQLLEQGRQALAQQDYLDATRTLTRALEAGLPDSQDREARAMINAATDEWLFGDQIYEGDPFGLRHQVKAGELLVQIGKQYAVPYPFLQRVNKLAKPQGLRTGQTIKVVQGPFHAVVHRQRFLMSVYLGDLIVRSYPVGLGAAGRETPPGIWQVSLKQLNPEWVDPETHKKYLPDDPDNPVGDHWIALTGVEGEAVGRTGFGIHGTSKPEEIGKQTSRGCIRLHNGNAAELFDLLEVGKSRVQVLD